MLSRVKEPDFGTMRQECIGVVDEVLQGVRKLSQVLRPVILDDFGLDSGLRWLCERSDCGHLHLESRRPRGRGARSAFVPHHSGGLNQHCAPFGLHGLPDGSGQKNPRLGSR